VDRNGKIARNQGTGWLSFSTNEGWQVQNATAIEANPGGGVWIGTQRNGLHLWRERIVTSLTIGDARAGNVVRSLLASPGGDLWIGTTTESLQRWHDDKLQSFKMPVGCGPVRAMALDSSGKLWVGTASGLLLRVEGDALVPETLAALPQAIRCLYVSGDGSLWIGYSGTGLGRLKHGRFTQFRARQGLHDDYISQIMEDSQGRLWLAGNQGIFCVKEEEFEAVAAGRLGHVQSVVFGREEGLPPLQTSWEFWPGAVRTKEGRLCIAMRTGLAMINAEALKRDPTPPRVLIEGVAVDGREVAAYDVSEDSASKLLNLRETGVRLELPPSHQQVAFTFTSPSFATARSVAFKYRLESLDKDWVDVGARRTAYYTHLPPGDYRFHVMACNRDGIWNEEGGSLPLKALPFFWETAWFRVAAVLVACSLLAGAVLLVSRRRYQQELAKLEQQRLLERERTRIAQDLHDDLGAGLVEISFGSELAQDPNLAVEEAREHTREIGTRAREMVTALDEIVWAVNPKHDNLASLTSYFCQYAQHFLRTTQVKCHLEIAKDLPAAALNAEERHSLFLALKEALSNVVQHAGAKDLRLAISAGEGILTIAISDNGCGLAPDRNGKETGADGLSNMQDRLRQIGGRCEVSSAPGQQTTIKFKVPLQSAGATKSG
jgi:signal transduction histidine kinase